MTILLFVGDIESMPFVEALRQLKLRMKPENFCLVHVSMVPSVGSLGEQKTKPTQHSVKELRSLGLEPDFIVCRSNVKLSANAREKIALYCNLESEKVLSIYDVGNTYEVPLLMMQQRFHVYLQQKLCLPLMSSTAKPNIEKEEKEEHAIADYYRKNHYFRDLLISSNKPTSLPSLTSSSSSTSSSSTSSTVAAEQREEEISYQVPLNHKFLHQWASLADRMNEPTNGVVKIVMVGKYNVQEDSYLSIVSAIKHSCLHMGVQLDIMNVDALHLEENSKSLESEGEGGGGGCALYEAAWTKLRSADGILVPGGFGSRGIEGKILAAKYAREHRVPYFGICLGMQIAVIEYCRSKLGRRFANSEEFDAQLPAEDRAVVFMPEGSREKMGGTMRLGSRTSYLKADSLASELYHGETEIDERHRHRYEVNPQLVSLLEREGLIFSGKDESNIRMEIIELSRDIHPYFVGCQFHPEFKSRPNRPAPLFMGFIRASCQK
jgi:CTP synthase